MQRWRAGLFSVVIVAAGVLMAPATAGAGGWAVSTLDPMTVPVAGTTTPVGFTIRQHGVRAVNPDGEVGVATTSPSGAEQFFRGVAQGAPGHYVARVRFAEPGSVHWSIRQGWFRAQDLGRITVAPVGAAGATTASGASGSTFRGPASMRLLLPVLGIGLGIFAVADALRTRRRRSRGLITT